MDSDALSAGANEGDVPRKTDAFRVYGCQGLRVLGFTGVRV